MTQQEQKNTSCGTEKYIFVIPQVLLWVDSIFISYLVSAMSSFLLLNYSKSQDKN